MSERGFLWGRDIVVENTPNDLALRLNVEQPLWFNGRIREVEYTFEVMCNPLYAEDVYI